MTPNPITPNAQLPCIILYRSNVIRGNGTFGESKFEGMSIWFGTFGKIEFGVMAFGVIG